MASEKLVTAVQLIRSGEKVAAIALLKEVLQEDPKDEDAWLWLHSCLDDPEQKKFCIKKALEINPNNLHAQRAWAKLTGATARPGSKGKPRSNRSQTSLLLGLGAIGLLVVMFIGGAFVWMQFGQQGAQTASNPLRVVVSPTPVLSSTPLPSATPFPTETPSPSATPTPSPAATLASLPFEPMEALDSYRIHGNMSMMGFGNAAGLSWLFSQEWVKASASSRTSLRLQGAMPGTPSPDINMPTEMEIVMIGESAWVKNAGQWTKVDPEQVKSQQQNVASPVSELKNLTFVGEEVVNGVICIHYKIDMPQVMPTVAATEIPQAEMRAVGDVWVASQPGFPAVVMRMRIQLKMSVEQTPDGLPTRLPLPTATFDPFVEQVATPVVTVLPINTLEPQTVAYYFEYEVSEVNTEFTIEPPETP